MGMSVYLTKKDDYDKEEYSWEYPILHPARYLGPCCREDDYIINKHSKAAYGIYAAGEVISADKGIKFFKLVIRIRIKRFVKEHGGELADYIISF